MISIARRYPVRPYAFSVGLFCLAAVAVIALTRGRLLSRQPDRPLDVCPTRPSVPLIRSDRTVVELPPSEVRAVCCWPDRSVSALSERRRVQIGFHGRRAR